MRKSYQLSVVFLAIVLVVSRVRCLAQERPAIDVRRIDITIAEGMASQPMRGRLLVYLSQSDRRAPIEALNWFHPEPFFAIDVDRFASGETRTIDEQADGFPQKLSRLPAGTYYAQAVLDQDIYYPQPARGPGNLYSLPTRWTVESGSVVSKLDMQLTHRVPEPTYERSQFVDFVERKSERLSEFFGRDFIDRAAVILPPSYFKEPGRRFPVYYEVTGFGGTLHGAERSFVHRLTQNSEPDKTVEFIHVLLTGECKWGHHVYANSATNGPRGDVLVYELIPWIDSHYRTIADHRGRFVGGHSSGGWSSLWLQVSYPKTFGGVWSTSPDPVDFRDWQGTNLYHDPPLSVFFDGAGKLRPLARRGTEPILFYRDFCKMDDVLGRGGQLRSFEAVFSPLDSSGRPMRCWDRERGVVDPQVVEQWKAYDISLKLEAEWSQLKDDLAGKLHISMGELDTFYLEGATIQLAHRLKQLGSDARVEIIPKAGHGLPATVQARDRAEMREQFLLFYDVEGRRRN